MTITLTETYVRLDGSPGAGSVSVRPVAMFFDGGRQRTVLGSWATVKLDDAGTFTMTLDTDLTNTTPTPIWLEVLEDTDCCHNDPWTFDPLDPALPDPITLSGVRPPDGTPASTPARVYVPVPGPAGAGVVSVNGDTGPDVVLAPYDDSALNLRLDGFVQLLDAEAQAREDLTADDIDPSATRLWLTPAERAAIQQGGGTGTGGTAFDPTSLIQADAALAARIAVVEAWDADDIAETATRVWMSPTDRAAIASIATVAAEVSRLDQVVHAAIQLETDARIAADTAIDGRVTALEQAPDPTFTADDITETATRVWVTPAEKAAIGTGGGTGSPPYDDTAVKADIAANTQAIAAIPAPYDDTALAASVTANTQAIAAIPAPTPHWFGGQADYDLIAQPDPAQLYIITS